MPPSTLYYLGAIQSFYGVFLLAFLTYSIYDPRATLRALGVRSGYGVLSDNSWQQTAVAFGMHGYADVRRARAPTHSAANARDRYTREPTPTPKNSSSTASSRCR
jgi:hypothetical protein